MREGERHTIVCNARESQVWRETLKESLSTKLHKISIRRTTYRDIGKITEKDPKQTFL
jgi:hypothetical protein